MSTLTLADARRLLRGRYGLPWGTGEDPEKVNDYLTEAINTGHAQVADECSLYFDPALSKAITTGNATYTLDTSLIRPRPGTFRLDYASSYTPLVARTYESLLEQYGSLEAVASARPEAVFLYPGAAANEPVKVQLVPAPAANGTLYYGGWKWPAALALDADLFPCHDALVRQMVPVWARHLAEFDLGRGRANAAQLIENWEPKAKAALEKIRALALAAQLGSEER